MFNQVYFQKNLIEKIFLLIFIEQKMLFFVDIITLQILSKLKIFDFALFLKKIYFNGFR